MINRTSNLFHSLPASCLPGAAFPGKTRGLKKNRGFSLISAIFLLVVIAALGAFAVTLSTTQHQSAALDVMGVRAYQASRSGVEWGAYQALINGSCSATQTLPALPGTLANFTVVVSCTSSTSPESSGVVNMYQITSVAHAGTAGAINYIERQMSVTIAK